MSLLSLLDPKKEVSKTKQIFNGDVKSTSVGDAFSAQRADDTFNNSANGEINRYDEAVNRLNKDFFRFDAEAEKSLSEEEREIRTSFRSLGLTGRQGVSQTEKSKELLNRYKEIRPDLEIPDIDAMAVEIGKEASVNARSAAEGNDTLLSQAAGIAGSFAAAAQDPSEWIAALAPVGRATSVLRAFAFGAAENVAVEASKTGQIKELQESIGEEYGSKEVVRNLIGAGLFGGALGAGGKILGNVLSGRKTDLTAPEGIIAKTDTNKTPQIEGSDLSKQIDEVLKREDVPDEVKDALTIVKRNTEDMNNRPPDVELEAHSQNMVEINKALEEGGLPDLRKLNIPKVADEIPGQRAVDDAVNAEPNLTPEQASQQQDLFDNTPRYENKAPDEFIREAEVKSQTVVSNDYYSSVKEGLAELEVQEPDTKFLMNNKEVSIAELRKTIDENENVLKSLDICKVV